MQVDEAAQSRKQRRRDKYEAEEVTVTVLTNMNI